jgi:DNA-binding response OmpR family regulator
MATDKTVLIVEDEKVFRELLTQTLEMEGFQCLSAENGEQALALLKKTIPDVILTDLLMPVLDGMKFIKRTRQEFQEDIPILVLTCVDSRSVVLECLIAGATEVLVKPIQLDILLERLKSLG